ncbi:uncharacterized protein IL334_003896 [Kwoniella shivajii]|uniref:CUE domain-containing protein n=1 Tax=Kwoniella shivajii TaxID=564305 RepID=A0ABZ1CZ85_9TREE|nr:hypothetical protein IL334_003896 [Kwoniella shivajii]
MPERVHTLSRDSSTTTLIPGMETSMVPETFKSGKNSMNRSSCFPPALSESENVPPAWTISQNSTTRDVDFRKIVNMLFRKFDAPEIAKSILSTAQLTQDVNKYLSDTMQNSNTKTCNTTPIGIHGRSSLEQLRDDLTAIEVTARRYSEWFPDDLDIRNEKMRSRCREWRDYKEQLKMYKMTNSSANESKSEKDSKPTFEEPEISKKPVEIKARKVVPVLDNIAKTLRQGADLLNPRSSHGYQHRNADVIEGLSYLSSVVNHRYAELQQYVKSEMVALRMDGWYEGTLEEHMIRKFGRDPAQTYNFQDPGLVENRKRSELFHDWENRPKQDTQMDWFSWHSTLGNAQEEPEALGDIDSVIAHHESESSSQY